MKRNRLLFLLSILGILVSSYLLQRYISGGPIICGSVAGCETVRASPYAYFFRIPLPAFGLLFYFLVFVTSFSVVLWPLRANLAKRLLLLETSAGVLVSLYLFGLEIFVIRAICIWCTVSGLVSLLLFLLAIPPLKLHNDPKVNELRG